MVIIRVGWYSDGAQQQLLPMNIVHDKWTALSRINWLLMQCHEQLLPFTLNEPIWIPERLSILNNRGMDHDAGFWWIWQQL